MEKFLSIIIPVFNMERYLPECLNSLWKQHFGDDVEILLLDDGSRDGSGRMIDEVAAKDPHIRAFHQKNSGVAATRNRGLREARGTYIAWVDPDDYITDDWWQVLRPVLQKHPDMVYFDMKILEDGKRTDFYFDTQSRIIGREELFQQLANGSRIKSHLWSKIILRTLFDHNKTFDETMSYCEDYEAMHRITFPVRECVYLHNCLYVYRQVKTSLVHDEAKMLGNLWLGIELSRKRRDFYRNRGVRVSDFGVLYTELLFCITYRALRGHADMPAEMKERYEVCIGSLKKNYSFLVHSRYLQRGMKIRLVLLLHHVYFLAKMIPAVKKILKH